jgi:hypothetical protein
MSLIRPQQKCKETDAREMPDKKRKILGKRDMRRKRDVKN